MTRTILFFCLVSLTTLLPRDAFAAIVINEFLADPPPGLAGDANRDGVRGTFHDEFVELLNRGIETVDLLSWSLSDDTEIRHEFKESLLLAPGERFVIFGGGEPEGFEGGSATASSGRLSLNNDGDRIILKDALGTLIDLIAYGGEAGLDQSLTRWPEGNGPFDLHTAVSSIGLLYSPGADPDGRTSIRIPVTPEASSLLLLIQGVILGLLSIGKTTLV